MDFDLRRNTILLTVAGSRAYGLHRADSDVDLKGAAMPSARVLHGFLTTFAQADDAAQMAAFVPDLTHAERQIASRTKVEGSIYDVRKLFRLAADCNPNLLDPLFCRDAEVRICTPLGQRLREIAPAFLSAKARHTFGGYAAAQLKRIQGHRRWLLDPPTAPPRREDFDLPERTLIPSDQLAAVRAAVKKKIDGWEIDFGALPPSEVIHLRGRITDVLTDISSHQDGRFETAARAIGLDENFIALLDRERRYGSAHHHYKQYERWKRERNPARAALEAAHGYDTKHAAHLIRLLRMGTEIGSTGQVHIWRGGRDADELQAIRGGQWTYDNLMVQVDREETLLKTAYSEELAVPERPDLHRLDALAQELVEAWLAG